jgi:hypothetical protein
MLKELPESEGALLALRVGGMVTKAEIETVRERLDGIDGKARLLLELEGMVGLTPAGFWEDLKMSLRHLRTIERAAIVGDQRWLGWWVKGLARVSPSETRHFRSAERTEALAWLDER